MNAVNFAVGERFQLRGEAHRIFRQLDNGDVSVEELATGRVKEFTIAALLAMWNSGDLILGSRKARVDRNAVSAAVASVYAEVFHQSYSEEQQAVAKGKLVYVQRLKDQPKSAILAPRIEEIWSDNKLWNGKRFPKLHAPHFTTVARWTKAYTQSGNDIRALVGNERDKGSIDRRMDGAVREKMDDLIATRYMSEERPTMASVYRDLTAEVARLNTTRIESERAKRPSFKTFQRAVHAVGAYDVYRARYGKRLADIRFRAAGRGIPPERPLARAAMDHCRLDLFVVDEKLRLPLGRPWLTLIIDECTRYILGYAIGFEEPSSVSMTRALQNAIAPKEPSRDAKATWDAWGIPDVLVVDNGCEFHSHALEMAMGQYGITIEFCPRKQPWYKGKVERFFGTFNTDLLSELKGKTFSNILLRGDYDPAKHSVVTFATLKRIVHKWILDIYHQAVHRTLKTTPELAWKAGIADVDRYLPPSSIALESAFSASVTKRLTHKGIEHDSLFYNSPELRTVRSQFGAEIRVEVRVNNADIGSLIVVAPDGKTLVRVPALDMEYAAGLTRWQHGVCRRYQRRILEDEGREIRLLEAREEIRKMIEEDMLFGGRKTRKRQARFTEGSPSSTAPQQSAPLTSAASEGVAPVGGADGTAPTPANAAATGVITGPATDETGTEVQTDDPSDDQVPVFDSYKRKQEAA